MTGTGGDAARSFTVARRGPLVGRIRVPGDKSLSHRALLLGALADGTSDLRGLSDGDDVARTAAAVRALGAEIDGDRITGGRAARAGGRRPVRSTWAIRERPCGCWPAWWRGWTSPWS